MAGGISPKSPKYRTDIGLRLKLCREKKFGEKHGAMSECAAELGVGISAWRRYEVGDIVPSSETIAVLAGFFDVDPTWLLTGQGSMDAHQKKIVDGFTSQQVRAVYEVDQIIQDLTEFRGRLLQEPLLAADYVCRIHEELLHEEITHQEPAKKKQGRRWAALLVGLLLGWGAGVATLYFAIPEAQPVAEKAVRQAVAFVTLPLKQVEPGSRRPYP